MPVVSGEVLFIIFSYITCGKWKILRENREIPAPNTHGETCGDVAAVIQRAKRNTFLVPQGCLIINLYYDIDYIFDIFRKGRLSTQRQCFD